VALALYKCSKCGKEKPANQFYRRSNVARARAYACADCHRELVARKQIERLLDKLGADEFRTLIDRRLHLIEVMRSVLLDRERR